MYIIHPRIKDRLSSPLRLTTYLLNPHYYNYRNDEAKLDPDYMGAYRPVSEKTFSLDDFQTQILITNIELHKYRKL